jgi:hypothetical protein
LRKISEAIRGILDTYLISFNLALPDRCGLAARNDDAAQQHVADTGLMECLAGKWSRFGLMSRITLPHFSASLAMSL